VWVQLARGALTLNGVAMSAGDGAGVTDEPLLAFELPNERKFFCSILADQGTSIAAH
jgi:Quercetinase C-terminal cupin domain